MNKFTQEEKQLAKEVSDNLDKLLLIHLVGGVGHQYDRDSAKLMVDLLRKINDE